MADYTLTTFLVVMVVISVGLGMYNSSIISYNPTFEDNSFNFSSTSASKMTYLGTLESGIDTNDFNESDLFSTADSVDIETGQIYTDSWKSTNKFMSALNGLWTLTTSLFLEPARFMMSMNVPVAYAVGFQIIWNIIVVFLLLNFRKGGT